MFKLFKRKNKIKELETRILVLESQVAALNTGKSNGDLILQIDGDVIGKVALKQLRKMQRQSEITLVTV